MSEMSRRFQTAEPFPHLVLDGLWRPNMLDACREAFDEVSPEGWVEYQDADEWGKRACNRNLPLPAASLFGKLNSISVVRMVERFTGMNGLFADPGLYGGGLHATRPGGFLGVHLDNEIHPQTRLMRRLNLIIYLNREWKDEWGGELELFDRLRENIVTRIVPKFNRTVIFETFSHSFHGHTNPVACPDGIERRSAAVFYWGEPRKRARFLPTAEEESSSSAEDKRMERSRA